MNKRPLVSVIVPVYNGSAYLAESIESILAQTMDDFELIVINDGSKDTSEEVVKKYQHDSRVKYISQDNMGLAKSLNKAITQAQAEFIARQDQDDISFPDRLEKQLNLFKKNPELGLIGGGAEIVDVHGFKTGRIHRNFTDDTKVKAFLLFDNPLFHSSVMFRKTLFESTGSYSWASDRQPEDYDLWSRMALQTKVSGVEEPVIKYRETPGSMSRINDEPFPKMYNITQAYVEKFLGLTADESLCWALWVHKKKQKINPIVLFKVVVRLFAKNKAIPLFFWRRIASLFYRA